MSQSDEIRILGRLEVNKNGQYVTIARDVPAAVTGDVRFTFVYAEGRIVRGDGCRIAAPNMVVQGNVLRDSTYLGILGNCEYECSITHRWDLTPPPANEPQSPQEESTKSPRAN